MECIPKLMSYTQAFSFLTNFYADKRSSARASEHLKSGRFLLYSFDFFTKVALGKVMVSITDFSSQLVIALAHIVQHLSTYNVADVLSETQFFTKFSNMSRMVLAANTLRNLEIFENETDRTVHGSLLWVLDHTKTRFGSRLMKNWVGHPLTHKEWVCPPCELFGQLIICLEPSRKGLMQWKRSSPVLLTSLSSSVKH